MTKYKVYLVEAVQHWVVEAKDKKEAILKVENELGSDWDIICDYQDPDNWMSLWAEEAEDEEEEEEEEEDGSGPEEEM